MIFQKSFPNFFSTPDREQIFYIKNFDQLDSQKPVLLFNYGLVCSMQHWEFQVKKFDELGFQILVHDYRGHFQSTGIQNLEKITFEQLSQDTFLLCEHLNIKKVIALGHSMGVNVTLEMAKNYPDLIEGMVLVSGTFLPVTDVMFDTNLMEFIMPMAISIKNKFPAAFDKIWKTGGMNPVVRELIHLSGFNYQQVSKEFIEIYLNRLGQLGVDLFVQLFNQMTSHSISHYLQKIEVPTLIIGGLKDGVIPNHLQRKLATLIPESETYFLKTGSHVPQVDFPDFVNERIEIFFRQRFNLPSYG